MPIETEHATTKSSYAIKTHWIETAKKYPMGFFVSNGNLSIGKKPKTSQKNSFPKIRLYGTYHIGTGKTNESLSKLVVT